MSGLVVYPVPLGSGRWVELRLPSDLTRADITRIAAVLQALAPDEVPPAEDAVGLSDESPGSSTRVKT